MTDPLNWASDTDYPAGSDPWSATATKVAPSAGQIAAGFAPTEKPPAQWFNYIFQRLYLAIMDRANGAASSTDNAIARFDGTGGKTVQNSGVTIDDSGNVALPSNANLSLAGTGEHNYAAARSTTKPIGMFSGIPQIGGSGTAPWQIAATSFAWLSLSNTGTMIFDITHMLPRGAVLTAVAVDVNPGSARTGTNRMNVQIWKHTAPTTSSQIGSTTYDDTTTNQQTITISGLSETMVVGTISIAVMVSAGNDGATNIDAINGLTITFDDPGPRNY